MAEVHAEFLDTTTNDSESIKSESTDYVEESTDSLEESMDNSEPEEEPIDSDSGEPEDFWTLLIRATVKEIYFQRIMNDLPVPIPDTNAEDFLEGKIFNSVLSQMRKQYNQYKDLHNAADDDKLLDIILSTSMAMFEHYDTSGNDEDAFEEQAEILAWKKFKYLIKKKIQNNLDEFDILISENSDTEESD